MDKPTKNALYKRINEQHLTYADQRVLARWDKAEADRLLRAVPLDLMRRLTGLTKPKLAALQKDKGLAVSGAFTDLFVVLPSLLEALDLDPEAGNSPALERWRKAKAEMAELDLGRKRGELIPVLELRERLNEMATIIRQHGEAMEKVGGSGARREFDEMVDDLESTAQRWLDEAKKAETADGQETEDDE